MDWRLILLFRIILSQRNEIQCSSNTDCIQALNSNAQCSFTNAKTDTSQETGFCFDPNFPGIPLTFDSTVSVTSSASLPTSTLFPGQTCGNDNGVFGCGPNENCENGKCVARTEKIGVATPLIVGVISAGSLIILFVLILCCVCCLRTSKKPKKAGLVDEPDLVIPSQEPAYKEGNRSMISSKFQFDPSNGRSGGEEFLDTTLAGSVTIQHRNSHHGADPYILIEKPAVTSDPEGYLHRNSRQYSENITQMKTSYDQTPSPEIIGSNLALEPVGPIVTGPIVNETLQLPTRPGFFGFWDKNGRFHQGYQDDSFEIHGGVFDDLSYFHHGTVGKQKPIYVEDEMMAGYLAKK